MEETTEWAKRIAPAAVVQKRTWPVLVHGVRVADYPRSAGEKNTRRIETENNSKAGYRDQKWATPKIPKIQNQTQNS
jgi:hypothetical protein